MKSIRAWRVRYLHQLWELSRLEYGGWIRNTIKAIVESFDFSLSELLWASGALITY